MNAGNVIPWQDLLIVAQLSERFIDYKPPNYNPHTNSLFIFAPVSLFEYYPFKNIFLAWLPLLGSVCF